MLDASADSFSPPHPAGLGRPESEDLLLIRLVCTAMVDLADHAAPAMFKLPYPASAQRAVDLIAVRCIQRGQRPPTSVPDLVRWCRDRPLVEWDLNLHDWYPAGIDTIIDAPTSTPTQLCYELAVDAPDATADLIEDDLLSEAIRLCRDENRPDSYVAFRRLLIESPVLDPATWISLNATPDLEPLIELIRACYRPMPATYIRDDVVVTCGRCRCPLTPTLDDGWACELDRCRWEGLRLGDRRRAAHTLHVLHRALRMFITGPGRAETELEADLKRLGLQVEMWPNIDTYDLRVSFRNGQVWAIDVKDRASPGILGRTAAPLRPNPPYTRAFYVVPDYRREQREDYDRVFWRSAQHPRDKDFRFAFSSALVKAAKKELRHA